MTNTGRQITKIAIIRQRSDGYYVLSESGKNLGGPYKTRAEAKKRLDQVEMFKHMKKQKKRSDALYFLLSLADTDASYSATMRKLRKGDKNKLRQFQQAFKKSFDDAYCQGLEPVENIALLAALKKIDHE